MKSKTLALRISAIIFGIVSIIHLGRIVSGVTVFIGSWPLPLWVNWMGLVGTLFLFGWLWRLSHEKKAN